MRASRYIPALAGVRVLRTYAGLRPWVPDGRPLIGPTIAMPGLMLATGHAGDGNTGSLLTGRLVAELAAGRPTALPVEPIKLEICFPLRCFGGNATGGLQNIPVAGA